MKFYPTKKSDFEEVNQIVTFNENVYYLGLDRGEKSLVSWCLIDSGGQSIKNGDWTTFKDLKNSEHETNYADKLKNYITKKIKLAGSYQIDYCGHQQQSDYYNDSAISVHIDTLSLAYLQP